VIHAGFPFRGLYLSIRAAGSGSDLSHNAQPEMMKLKSNQTRTYDGDGYKKRAACLCFRSEDEQEVSTGAGEANGPPGGRARDACVSQRVSWLISNGLAACYQRLAWTSKAELA